MTARRPFSRSADHAQNHLIDSSSGLSAIFLRFDPAIRDSFERETGEERCKHLRQSIIVGLLFYNAYSISDFLLVPDVAIYSTIARLFVITPIALALAWLIPRLNPALREAMIALAMVGVVAVPCLALAFSRAPYASITFSEMPLVLVFGGMMLVLRVDGFTFFASICVLSTAAAIAEQPAFAGRVAWAMLLQIFTACAFVVYGNRQIELVRRTAYLVLHRESLRSRQLEETQRRLTALSATDALTGLANRRALNEALSLNEVAEADIALIMVDIDHFKPFNDRYGHAAGDQCIQAVSAALLRIVGPDDLVARYGGEEFAVVIEDPGPVALQGVMHRLCAEVRSLPIRHDARPDGKFGLTVSAGAATLTMALGSARILVDRADGALYMAKKNGRDRYETAGLDCDFKAA